MTAVPNFDDPAPAPADEGRYGAVLELPARTNGHHPPADEASPFVDWTDFWATDHTHEDWLDEPWLARGRGHAIYAGHKQGKSLFLLARAAHLATTRQDLDVVYLDYEMSREDVIERLTDMGHGPDTDLARLHYAFAPRFAPLDTPAGAADLEAALDRIASDRHLVVVIDTMGRAVEGDENSNDTYRAFYRWTGAMLRHRRATWARLDHAGKDATRGQRGASAKGDDVDIIWKLNAGEKGMTLHLDNARVRWAPAKVTYAMGEDPLRYTPTTGVWPAGTSECADDLDELGVPDDAPTREAQATLKEAGRGRRRDVVVAAQKWRRDPTRVAREPLAEPLAPVPGEPQPEPQP